MNASVYIRSCVLSASAGHSFPKKIKQTNNYRSVYIDDHIHMNLFRCMSVQYS